MDFTHPDFTIIRELGRGASGVVYLAVQNRLNRRVAVKVFTDTLARQVATKRFLREARILAQLDHPNIVPVYDLTTLADESGYLISMAYVDGGSLRDRAESLTLQQCHSVIVQIADALGYAYDAGFVHRDVKPDNILFQGDKALLVDFGIARATNSKTGLTQVGAILGTAEYMSPELVIGSNDIDLRSDLYSLAIVFYTLLAGQSPFKADSAQATQMLHLSKEIPPLPEAFSRYQPFMQKWLAKNKDDRPIDAQEFIADVHNLLKQTPLNPELPLSVIRSGDGTHRVDAELVDKQEPTAYLEQTGGRLSRLLSDRAASVRAWITKT